MWPLKRPIYENKFLHAGLIKSHAKIRVRFFDATYYGPLAIYKGSRIEKSFFSSVYSTSISLISIKNICIVCKCAEN